MRVRAVGKLDLLPDSLLSAIRVAEEATAAHRGMLLTIAVAYGGRQEIIDAVQARSAKRSSRARTIAQYLYAPDRASCSGRAPTASSTSATSTGRPSAGSTSCAPCARSSSAIAASGRSLPPNLRSFRLQRFAHVRDDGHPRRGDERQLKELDPAHPRAAIHPRAVHQRRRQWLPDSDVDWPQEV